MSFFDGTVDGFSSSAQVNLAGEYQNDVAALSAQVQLLAASIPPQVASYTISAFSTATGPKPINVIIPYTGVTGTNFVLSPRTINTFLWVAEQPFDNVPSAPVFDVILLQNGLPFVVIAINQVAWNMQAGVPYVAVWSGNQTVSFPAVQMLPGNVYTLAYRVYQATHPRVAGTISFFNV